MEKFCGSRFWDPNITWHTSNPDFTTCFENTVLLWSTCGFLWITAALQFWFSSHPSRSLMAERPTWLPAWSQLGMTKIFNIALLIILEVAALTTSLFINRAGESNAIFGKPIEVWITPLILLTTHFLSACLVVFHKMNCVHISGTQLIHWLLLSMVHGLRFRTMLLHQLDNGPGSIILTGLTMTLAIIQAILFCWSDIPKSTPDLYVVQIDSTEESLLKGEECPISRASCLSWILFSWCTPLVRKGYSTPLKLDDIWELVQPLKALVVFPIFNCSYGKPAYGEVRGIFRNILRPLWATCGKPFVIGTICSVLATSLNFAIPSVMGYLIDFVNDPSIETWKGYMWALVIFLTSMTSLILQEQFYLLFFICHSNVLPCLNLRIYKKALNISHAAKRESTTGEIVNLMSVDVEKIRVLIYDANIIIGTVVQLTIGVILLWSQLDHALWPGLGTLIALIPINWYLSLLSTKYQRAQMKKKDERVKIITEVLSGIQVIKLYAWEAALVEQIRKVRKEELAQIRKRMIVRSFMEFIFRSIPFLVSYASFLAFVYLYGGVLDAKNTFVSISLFNLLTNSLQHIPGGISAFVDAAVSFKRINKFLNAEEFHPDATKYEEKNDIRPAVEIRNGSFSWDDMATCNWKLSNINFVIQPKTLTAIVGSVASGKTSLLSAILGEMKYAGDVVVRGRIAYVPQVAWILNATLRENICFGLDYEKSKYDKIVEACCLTPDIEMLPAGDMTEIGEKGINLSGGQKQRVSLARAVYSGADIYLLDDVLSAVDSHVGKHIFDRLLGPGGLLSGKTRILCTHAYNFLSQVDRVVVMDEGKIVEEGTYDDLMQTEGSFSMLLSRHIQSKKVGLAGEEVEEDNVPTMTADVLDSNDGEGRLIQEEHLETGDVKLSVFLAYIRALKAILAVAVVIFLLASESLNVGKSIVLVQWSDHSRNSNETGNILPFVIEYAVLGVLQSICCLLGYIFLAFAALRAAERLHHNMLSRILRAPMSFFNVTPLGRITNRFSSDIETVDQDLPSDFGDWVETLINFFGIIVAVSYTNPYFPIAIIPVCLGYYSLQRYYIKVMQQLQRILNATKSPIFAMFQESLGGQSSIRAYQAEERFVADLGKKLDTYNRTYLPHLIVRRWLSIRLGTLGSLVVLFPAVMAVLWRDSVNPSLVGMSIYFSMNVVNVLSWLIKVTSYLQYRFVSVERIVEYSGVRQEADYETKPEHAIRQRWPEKGEIMFAKYATRYRAGLDLVLKNFSCLILPGEKIGIVGRTGAGKSSLTLALFRIIESVRGNIFIDHVDIADLGLHDVRKRLTVIPQDPVLFSRTLRLNIDPFEEYKDEQLWEALRLAHLKDYVEGQPEGLSYLIAEGGGNLSVGQRQLICLARAILRKSSILVLDEATASVDSVTDELIQQTIRNHFKGCTILNVAHRLNTVMDSSRIMVLSRGEIVEFDTPQALLANRNSEFYGMAKADGIVN